MSNAGAIVIGCMSGPLRGVIISIDGVTIAVSPEVARHLARQLTESADRLEAAGGASPQVIANAQAMTKTESEEIMRDFGFEPPEEPS